MVVGWYHSHPGFGCWLSGVDVNTQQSFEALNARAVSIVVDPIQSVRGKVVIDAFRCISPQAMMLGQEPRQTTSNVGHLNKPSIQALIHGLNRHYYSMAINYRKTPLEEAMLLNLQKHTWTQGLTLRNFADHGAANAAALKELKDTSAAYDKAVVEEGETEVDRRGVASAGKMDARKRMEAGITALLTANITQSMGLMLDTIAF
jgi:26S proteasome regulatory subunit N11